MLFVFIKILYYITHRAYYFYVLAYFVFHFLTIRKINVTSFWERNPSEPVFQYARRARRDGSHLMQRTDEFLTSFVLNRRLTKRLLRTLVSITNWISGNAVGLRFIPTIIEVTSLSFALKPEYGSWRLATDESSTENVPFLHGVQLVPQTAEARGLVPTKMRYLLTLH